MGSGHKRTSYLHQRQQNWYWNLYSYYTCMHRQREDRLSMCSVLYFNLQPLIARCSGDPSWEELIMPRRHPSLCSPLQFQTASLWCGRAVPGTRAARDCMTVHDGRSGSFMTLYCRKACNHYSSTGQLFQYAADQHINRKHHLFVLPSCPAFIISIFPLSPFWLTPRSKHTDKQNPAAFTNIMQFAHTVHVHKYIRSFTPCTKA